MELKKILPNDGPEINEVKKYIDKYSDELIVIKCGGSVLLDQKLFDQFIEDISIINQLNLNLIVIHGDRVEALSCALTGSLNHILTAHIEGGEFVNRKIREAFGETVTGLPAEAAGSGSDGVKKKGFFFWLLA